jgi:hypothetical protein
MKTLLKIAAIVVGSLAALLVVAILTFDPNWLRSWLAERASQSAGRDIRIEGDLGLDWGWTPRLTIAGLVIENAPWAEAPHLAKVDRLMLRLDLWQLLQGRTVIPEVVVEGPELLLVRNEDGDANWAAGPPPGAAEEVAEEVVVPDDRTEFPIIGRLEIKDSRFVYEDHSRALDLDGTIDTVIGDGGAGEQVEVAGQGRLEGEPFELQLTAGTLLALRDPDQAYPVDLDVAYGETRLAVDGTLMAPLALAGADLALRIEGPSLADVFPLLGLPLLSITHKFGLESCSECNLGEM